MAYTKNKEKTKIELRDDKARDIVMQRQAKALNFFQKYIRDTDRWYKMYRNETTKPDNAYRSRASIPVGYWTVETNVAQEVAQPHQYTMTAVDTDNPMAVQYSIQAKHYYDYVLRQIGFRRKTRILAKDKRIFGSGFWKYSWDYQREILCLENLPLRQILIDPNNNDPGNLQKGMYVLHITRATEEELRSNPNYNLKGIDFAQVGTTDNNSLNVSRRDRLAARGLNADTRDKVEKDYQLIEHEGWYKGKRMIITVLEDKYVIREEECPYDFWQYGLAINTEDPDNVLGIGDLEPIQFNIEDLNSNRRMRTDNKNIRTNVMFEIQRAAGVREEELTWRPGGYVFSNIARGVSPIVIPDTTQGSVEEEQLTLLQIEKATGATATAMGQLAATSPESGGLLNRTATAYAGSQRATGVRSKAQSELLDNCIEETLRNMWKILQMNVKEDQVAEVIGEDGMKSWIKIPKEAIQMEYVLDLKYGSSALEDKQEKASLAMQKLQTLAGIFPEGAAYFLKDALIAAGDEHVEEIVQAVAKAREQAAAQGNLPKPPQINLSIGGEDMNSIMIGEILKNYYPQLSPIALTPEMFNQTRTLMQGQTQSDFEADKIKIELFKAITAAQQGQVKLDQDQMKIIGDILTKAQSNAQTQGSTAGTSTEPGLAGDNGTSGGQAEGPLPGA